MELVNYFSEHGNVTALIWKRGRKLIHIVTLHPGPRVHAVKLSEEKFMTPITAKKKHIVSAYRKNLTLTPEAYRKKARRAVREIFKGAAA